jgi:PKD repeat protein
MRVTFLLTAVLLILVSQNSAFGQCNPMPKADFTVNDVCEPDSSVFVNLSQDAETYFWQFGDGGTSTMKSPKHFYDPHVIHTHAPIAVLIAKNSNGCSDTIAKTPIVHANPKSDFSFIVNKKEVNFMAMQSGHTEYKWILGDGDSSLFQNTIYTYKQPGIYTACLNVTNAAGCFSKTCKSISVPCNAMFTKSNDTTQKFKIFLINNSTNTTSTTYQWDFGDGGSSTSRNPTHKFNTFGKFKVCLTVYDSGCSSSFCDTIGLDSSGKLLKAGSFEVVVKEQTGFILNKKLKTDFTIYPNPVNSKLTIDLSKSLVFYEKLEVINAIGQVCIKRPIEIGNRMLELDLRMIKTGLYFIKLSNNEDSSYLKIIKN